MLFDLSMEERNNQLQLHSPRHKPWVKLTRASGETVEMIAANVNLMLLLITWEPCKQRHLQLTNVDPAQKEGFKGAVKLRSIF